MAVPVLITVVAQTVIPPLIVFFVLFIVGLVWLGRDERKGTIMLGILALLFFGINVPFILDALAHPEAWSEFIPNVIGVLSAILALAAATALLRNRGTEKAAGTLLGSCWWWASSRSHPPSSRPWASTATRPKPGT
jgi:hypothetical protein